jgi:heme exporter protein CcmB
MLIIVSRISMPATGTESSLYGSYIILCAVFSSTINSFQELYHDFKTGHIHQFMISNLSGTSVTATYLLFKLFANNLLLIMVQPLIMIILSIPIEEMTSISTAALLAVSYNTIIAFVASCLNSINQNNILILILTLPLTIPAIILSIAGINHSGYHLLLTAIILSALPLSIFICEKVIIASISEG